MSDGPWDDFKGGGAAVADGPWNDFPAAPARPVTTARDEQASGDQIGNVMEPEGHTDDPIAAREDVLQESHPYAWARIRQTPFMRKLLGPTGEEQAAMAAGEMPGPPGGDVGLLPLALNLAPLAVGGFPETMAVPLMTGRAGQALVGYYVARNIASQPGRVAAVAQKFQEGDTKGAWHDILGDTLDTGMAALGAKGLAEGFSDAVAANRPPEVNIDTMRRAEVPGTKVEPRSPEAGAESPAAPWEDFAPAKAEPVLQSDIQASPAPPAETPPPTSQAEVVPTQPAPNGDVKVAPVTPEISKTPENTPAELPPAIDTRTPEQRMPGPNYVWNPANPLDENPPPALKSVSVAGMPGAESFNGNINAARDWALKNLRGTVTNQKTGLPIEIARAGVEKALSASAVNKSPNVKDHVDAVRAVPQLLSTADLVEARPAQKNPQNIGGILRFHAPLEVNGNPYTARLTVREHINPKGRKFYTYELMELEKEKPAATAQGAGGAGKGSSVKTEFPAATTAGTSESTASGAKVNQAPAQAEATPSEEATFGAGKLPLGVSKAQWDEMAALNDHQQQAKYGTTRAKLIEKVMLAQKPEVLPPVKVPKVPKGTRYKIGPPKPAEAPAQAAAKVEEHVQDVAQTEGQRPAKEVKAELLKRIEDAMHGAPEKSQYNPAKHGTVEIAIPGDGTFTIPRHLAALGEVRERVKGLSVSSGSSRGSAPMNRREMPNIDATVRDAVAVYGNEKAAIQKIEAQLQSDIEMSPEARTRLEMAVERLRAELPENKLRARIAEVAGKISELEQSRQGYERKIEQLKSAGRAGVKQKRDLQASLIDSRQAEQALAGQRTILANLNRELSALSNSPATENKVAGFGGGTRKAQKVSVPAGTPAQAPATSPLRQYLGNQAAGVQSVVAPQTLAPDARAVGNALRHFMGQNALAMARADEALQSWRAEFDKTPVPADYQYDPQQPLPHNYAVIDALERDRAALPTRYRDLADVFDKEFAWRIAEIQKFAPNALQHLIQNYFPHVWQDPMRAADVMAQVASRLFAGRKEFLKQRSLAFFGEGLAAGLQPISDNPVDLLMAKMHSMDKFILALRATSEFRASGAMKFKYLFERLPEGWTTIDDPSFIVQRPPAVTVTEAHDEFQRVKLGEILKDLGVSYKRVVSLGGRRWAEADLGMKEIRAKVGASEDILWHELGHHLDWKFPGLRNALAFTGNSPVAAQLRALVDLNHPGVPHDPKKNYHRYLRKTEEKMAEIFRAYVHAPDLFQKTAPDVWQVVKKFLDTQPGLRDKLDEMSHGRLAIGSESTQIKLGGMQQLGHWIMPVGPAQVIKNYLSPGLARFGAYRAFRGASNILNAAQLGLSAFHLGFTSLDAATSRLAIGIEDAANGKLVRAAKTFASIPASPVTNVLQGRRMIQEARTPGSTDAETAALVRALEQAGGRVGQDAFWKTHFTRRMIRALNETRNNAALFEMPDVKALLNAPFTLVEQAMRPIMEYLVPRQKLGVFADMARREIERLGPNAALDQTREAMRKAWDSVDNRMGQLVYDNLFYNRAVKDLALLSFRAYGWQLGKYREGIGALVDTGKAAKQLASGKTPEVSHRMAYAMALPMMIGMLGAIATYLMTRRLAQGMDYFMPPTGEKDSHGNLVRLNFPSYMKDVLAYGKHPITSFSHSLNPMFSGMFDLYENKDFYDVEIRHPDDPLWKQGSEVAQFAAKQFTPFSVSGAMKLREDASPMQKQVLPFFGITPAPARMTMTPAQELASDLMASGMGDAPLTQEQFDKSKMIRDAVRALKTGKGDGTKVFAEAIASGKLNPDATTALIDRLKYTPLQFQVFHLGTADAMKVWRVADPNEQAELQPLLVTKILNSKVVKPEDKAKYLGELSRPVR